MMVYEHNPGPLEDTVGGRDLGSSLGAITRPRQNEQTANAK